VVDGIIGGVGAVIGFVTPDAHPVPDAVRLEDVGYMAAWLIMDRIFRRFGLSGKCFILC
jgi:ferrous iron transport protein B